ncbi:MAG: SDR family NAD(P)-dependent oxidoreductase [Armatimonadota bacterium]
MTEARLAGKVAVVTGAARGLGQTIATTLAQAGAAVVVNGRPSGTDPGETVTAIERAGGRAHAVIADVADAGGCQSLVRQTLDEFGRLDILVNNAGVSQDALLIEMSAEAWDRVFAANVRSAFNCIKAAAPVMIEAGAGSIINISSVVADIGNIGATNYAASKGAVNSLTKSAAAELARFGVRVNAIAPGVVETELMLKPLERRRDNLMKRIPLRRFARPEEIARAVLFLASDDASYITGEIIRVAGGMGLSQ